MLNHRLSTTMVKRVKKEINKSQLNVILVDNQYIYAPLKLHPNLQKRAEAAGLDPALVITLHEYPWKVPQVHYFSHHVSAIYGCGANRLMDEIYKMRGEASCLCCSSILCSNNWNVTRGIKEIIDEFIDLTTLKARAQERKFCNRIQEKFFMCVKDSDGNDSLKCLPLSDYRISDFL